MPVIAIEPSPRAYWAIRQALTVAPFRELAIEPSREETQPVQLYRARP
jgi:hypothetical protein